MTCDVYEIVLCGADDLPSACAPDHVLSAWLTARFGRQLTYLEILEFRLLLQEVERRKVKKGWASWWRRSRPIRRPTHDDIVAHFLRSEEGQILFRLVGGVAALMAQLMLPDPFLGYDGRHPTAPRKSHRERLLERADAGLPVPEQYQAVGIQAYAKWKLTGLPLCESGFIPEDATFINKIQAAAINAMTPKAVYEMIGRLEAARESGTGYKSILYELERIGRDAKGRWPGIERRRTGMPLGLWPRASNDNNLDDRDVLTSGSMSNIISV